MKATFGVFDQSTTEHIGVSDLLLLQLPSPY